MILITRLQESCQKDQRFQHVISANIVGRTETPETILYIIPLSLSLINGLKRSSPISGEAGVAMTAICMFMGNKNSL
jgi:hypothetical protein